jgi:hypothetical protein
VSEYLKTHHGDEVVTCQGHRLIRKIFWAIGVNNFWCMDQHNKWQQYELLMELLMEPFTNQILYISIWWTNRLAIFNTGKYLDIIESLGNRESGLRAL